MSKLMGCLSKLQWMNSDGAEYSVGLAQDIQVAKDELRMLLGMSEEYVEEWSMKTSEDERRLYDELVMELSVG